MKRYKVALICDWYLPRVGGLELHLRDLARELNARGHEAHVICSTPGSSDTDGVQVKRLEVGRVPFFHTIRSPDALHKLERVLVAGKYDIVHAHTAFSPLALGAIYLARKLGIPSLFTEHSVLRGAGSLLLGSLDRLWGWSSWPSTLSTVSEYLAVELRELTGRTDIHVLHNAVRTEDWALERREEPRVISVLRFTKRKRPVDIVRMIPQIHERLPAALRPKFTLIGDGPERPRVEREARRLGVFEYLELPGFKSRKEIRELLARSAVFILPSQKEALSIVTIEARSAGVPVVARSSNGVSEIIQHGVHGFLATNTEMFVEHLIQLLREPELRAQMSAAGRQGLERFGWDLAVERHLRAYEAATQHHQALAAAGTSAPCAASAARAAEETLPAQVQGVSGRATLHP